MKIILGAQEPGIVMRTHMESCQQKEGGHMQSKAMEMLDNLDKNPATGMGKRFPLYKHYTFSF